MYISLSICVYIYIYIYIVSITIIIIINKLSGCQIRGWRAVSASGLQGRGSPKRSVFSQTPASLSVSLSVSLWSLSLQPSGVVLSLHLYHYCRNVSTSELRQGARGTFYVNCVCVCVCVYIYIYICIHTCTYTYIRVCICVYIYIYTYTCICICICICTYIFCYVRLFNNYYVFHISHALRRPRNMQRTARGPTWCTSAGPGLF